MRQINILSVHLEEMRRALDAAHRRSVAQDLIKGYDNLNGANRASNLTRALERAVGIADEYLNEREEDEAEEPEA